RIRAKDGRASAFFPGFENNHEILDHKNPNSTTIHHEHINH
ncbi:MAG: hypothetical protein ACI8RD_010773, partial [Bacillariaceae sp.]